MPPSLGKACVDHRDTKGHVDGGGGGSDGDGGRVCGKADARNVEPRLQ